MLQLRLKSFLQFRTEHIEVRLLIFLVTTFLFFFINIQSRRKKVETNTNIS